MRIHFMLIAALAAGFGVTGCGRVIQVQRDVTVGEHCSREAVPGIPFYSKRPRYVQEVVYQRTQYHVQGIDTITEENKPTIIELVAEGMVSSTQIDKLVAALGSVQSKEEMRTLIETAVRASGNEPGGGLGIKTTNRITTDLVVDTSKVYYVNVKRPVTGTASAVPKLNADQTLSEVNASINDTTLPTILSALPIKEVLSKLQFAAGAQKHQLSTKVEPPQSTKYTHLVSSETDLQPSDPVSILNPQNGWQMEIVAAAAKKEDKKAYTFEGSVALPK